jgi:radical SAM protein with 4Fe4S-binding SPASM domain
MYKISLSTMDIIPRSPLFSRKLNQALRLLDETFVSPGVRAMPRYISVTITGDCNIKCIYCERQKGSNVKDYYFPIDIYEQLEPYFNCARRVTLIGLGEPFMHRDLEKMIRMAKRCGAECVTTTNGTMLNDRFRRLLVELKLDYIAVSVDSADPATFEKLRAGASFERVIGNVKALRDLKREMGSNLPRLGLAMVVSKENVWHIPNMVRLAAELEAEDLHLQNIVLYRKEDHKMSVFGTRRLDWMIGRGRKLAADLGVTLQYVNRDPFTNEYDSQLSISPPIQKGMTCREAFTQALVYDNGDVRPCCFTEEIMGNVRENSIEEIFHGEKFSDFRNRILSGNLPRACIDCGYLIKRETDVLNERLHRAKDILAELENPDEKALLAEAIKQTEEALKSL